jgi:hypothetical protein
MLISKGFEPQISVGPELSLPLGARFRNSHNVIERSLRSLAPARVHDVYLAGPRLPVESPHTKPATSGTMLSRRFLRFSRTAGA